MRDLTGYESWLLVQNERRLATNSYQQKRRQTTFDWPNSTRYSLRWPQTMTLFGALEVSQERLKLSQASPSASERQKLIILPITCISSVQMPRLTKLMTPLDTIIQICWRRAATNLRPIPLGPRPKHISGREVHRLRHTLHVLTTWNL